MAPVSAIAVLQWGGLQVGTSEVVVKHKFSFRLSTITVSSRPGCQVVGLPLSVPPSVLVRVAAS